MIRFTLTDDSRLVAHGTLGERDLMPDEVEMLREAIEAKRLPWWIDLGAVVIGIAAVAVLWHGGVG